MAGSAHQLRAPLNACGTRPHAPSRLRRPGLHLAIETELHLQSRNFPPVGNSWSQAPHDQSCAPGACKASSNMPLGPRSRHRQLYWFVALKNPDTPLKAPHAQRRFADCREADCEVSTLVRGRRLPAPSCQPSPTTTRVPPNRPLLRRLHGSLGEPAAAPSSKWRRPLVQTTFAILAATLLMPKSGRERAAPPTPCRPNGLTC
jgi:hypothetical protein